MAQHLEMNQVCTYSYEKKREFYHWGENSTRKRFRIYDELPDFSLLPDLAVIKIFSYFSVEERCRLSEVCKKWYQISRSATLWRRVTLRNVTTNKLIQVLPIFPPYIQHLQLTCIFRQHLIPMWLPDVLAKVHQQCPTLRTLILEGAALVRHLCYGCSNEGVINTMLDSLNRELLSSANLNLSPQSKECYERDYMSTELYKNISVLLPNLEVLSLRKTMFNTFLFFSQISDSVLPSIKVLDLTCALRSYARHIPLSCRIQFLEELYLPGSVLSDEDIEKILCNAPRLKVLDVEHTDISEAGITAIKRYGSCLEKLFLANTRFSTFSFTIGDMGHVLTRLDTLCVRTTRVTRQEVERMLCAFPALRRIDVTFTEVSLSGLVGLPEKMTGRLVFEQDAEYLPFCNHFYSSPRYR